MSLTTICTACGTRQPVEAGFLDDDAKRIIAAFISADPYLARAALQYMRLFKPPQTELRLPKALKLLRALLELAEAGRVTADDRTNVSRPATVQHWIAGIEQILDKPPSGQLENHNYLRKIVFDLAGRPLPMSVAAPSAPGAPIAATGVSPVRPKENPEFARQAWLREQVRLGVKTEAEAIAEGYVP